MDIYQAIYARRTVRDFKAQEIDLEIIKKILQAGLRAPTNNHLREWEFVIVNDPSTRQKLIEKVRKSTTAAEVAAILDGWGCFDLIQRDMYFDGIPKQYKMLLTAGCLMIPIWWLSTILFLGICII